MMETWWKPMQKNTARAILSTNFCSDFLQPLNGLASGSPAHIKPILDTKAAKDNRKITHMNLIGARVSDMINTRI